MKLLFAALTLFTWFASSLDAQKVGEPWTDRTGMYVHYGEDGNFLLRIQDHHFQMIFLDDKNTVRTSPFARVFLRVESNIKKKSNMRLVLTASDGVDAFGSDRYIDAPYVFEVLVILYPVEGSDEGKITIPMTKYVWHVAGEDN